MILNGKIYDILIYLSRRLFYYSDYSHYSIEVTIVMDVAISVVQDPWVPKCIAIALLRGYKDSQIYSYNFIIRGPRFPKYISIDFL